MPDEKPIGRPRTVNVKLPLFKPEEVESYPRNVHRPKTRGDCVPSEEGGNHARPCKFVTCKYHLFVDVMRSGSLKLNWPADTLDELVENLHRMKYTCALDVADLGEQTLEDIGAYLNVTRERIRQLEEKLLARMRRSKTAGRAFGENVLVDGKYVDTEDFDEEFEPEEDDVLEGLFPSTRKGDGSEMPPQDIFEVEEPTK